MNLANKTLAQTRLHPRLCSLRSPYQTLIASVLHKYVTGKLAETSAPSSGGAQRRLTPRSRHGWGWGIPDVWQGWVVMAAFALLLLAGAVFLRPKHGQAVLGTYSAFLCAVLVAICWLKGEPPGWRWGGK